MFGASSQTTAFPFGSTTTTTAAPSAPLFGSTTTTTPKPLFGSTGPAASTPSLFGNLNTSTAPTTAPLFGSTATTTASTGLFGSNTATTSANTGLFGSTNTATTGGGLFGSTQPTSTGGLFGKPAQTGFGTSGSLFGPKPATGGLFGATTTQQQQQQATETRDSLQGILQNSAALVKSLTNVCQFGDDRDKIITRLNQLAAVLGTGQGYHTGNEAPVQYTPEGPFHRMKAIGYNMISEHTDADGIVALVIKAPHTEFTTTAQKQKFLDELFAVMGSKPGLLAHIESIKQLPGNCTEVCIYVTQQGQPGNPGKRISSKELATAFNQADYSSKLEAQLKVVKEKIVSRVAMGKADREIYLRDPPHGFDAALWAQAVRENPEPETLIPFPIRGFAQLNARQKAQISEVTVENHVLDMMLKRLEKLDAARSSAELRMAQQKVMQKQLSHRLLRVLAMQLLSQRFGHGIDNTEEQMQSALERINARLNAPNQVKSYISAIMSELAPESDFRRSTIQPTPAPLSESDVQQLRKYLLRCQDGLESLVSVANSNLKDLEAMAGAIDAS